MALYFGVAQRESSMFLDVKRKPCAICCVWTLETPEDLILKKQGQNMTGFTLKIKTRNGQEVLKTLGPFSTVGMLKEELSKLVKIPVNSLYILSGFPPEHLDLADDKQTLDSSNICSGDVLVVREKTPTSQEEEREIKQHSYYQDQLNSGILLKQVVPADNSCLFTSIGFALSGKINSNCATFMRKIIAEAVSNDPETYNEAFLGQPNAEYCEWIQQPTSWGGAIELAIMSKFYGIEIVVLDSVNGILNRFGEDQLYDYRIFLFFDGMHYDPLYFEDFQESRNDVKKLKTEFHTSDERMLQEAAALVKEAKDSRQFTDINKFTLKCFECDIFLTGQAEAREHAKETGHSQFGEINPD